MRTLRWTVSLGRRSVLAVAGSAVAVGLAVAFVASLASFVATTRADLTVRAAVQVPVDWQVQVTAQGDAAAVGDQVAGLPGLRAVLAVIAAGYAQPQQPALSGKPPY